jgi:hypothetical protein
MHYGTAPTSGKDGSREMKTIHCLCDEFGRYAGADGDKPMMVKSWQAASCWTDLAQADSAAIVYSKQFWVELRVVSHCIGE